MCMFWYFAVSAKTIRVIVVLILAITTIDSFTLFHETEAKTACDHIILKFELEDGSFLQIVVLKEVLSCISLHQTQFQTPKRKRLFSSLSV